MADPINNPLPAEDVVYADQPSADPVARTDPKQARIDAYDRKRQRERNELASVVESPAGQAVLLRVLGHCGVYQASFNQSHASASFAEGRRSVGLWLVDELTKLDPAIYPALLVSHAKRVRALADTEAGITAAKG